MENKHGRIVIPASSHPWSHELATAHALANFGKTVEFLPETEGTRVTSPDILMDGLVWEMKAPESSNVKSLQKTLRRAGRQSPNVIVDSSRMKGVPDQAVERELRRLLPLVKSISRLILVTKQGEVVDIGRNRH